MDVGAADDQDLPSGNDVAVWPRIRGVTGSATLVQAPVAGSKSSAVEDSIALQSLTAVSPDHRTLPSGRSVSVCVLLARGATMLPVAVQDPVAGS